MTDTIILGTIALDTIETPFGKAPDTLGGSATFAAFAASFFTKPGIISIIGEDFPKEHTDFLNKRGINLDGVEKKGKTFRWEGSYKFDMNEAKTLKTELNSLLDLDPKLPESYKKADYVFLGNTDPEIQLKVLQQLESPKMTIMDTMNLWIDTKKDKVIEVMKKINTAVLNEGEARMLFDTPNLIKAGKEALKLGPKNVIIKKGEHGSLYFTDSKFFNAPSYPLENIKDPTGCGDSFGGGLLGYLAKTDNISEKNIRKAIMYGTVIASFNAEDFSLKRQTKITLEDIDKRIEQIKEMRDF